MAGRASPVKACLALGAWTRLAIALALAGIVATFALAARAHDFTPGVLALAERSPGVFDMRWTPPVDSRSRVVPRVVFPAGCTSDERTLTCRGGLVGDVVFEDMLPEMQVVVVVHALDGTSREDRVAGNASRFRVAQAHGSTATWLVLGVEHILGGLDHVAFVLGLLLLVEGRKRLLLTITAFTVSHSVTLVLAALDVVRLPSAPVEATIAASVLLVAREGGSQRDTLSRRAPWLIALVFGLVHGLGFAGALQELGLPRESRAASLLLFNVGVELGQLAIVVVVLGGVHLAGRLARTTWVRSAAWLRSAACYAIGSVAAYWLVDRTAAILFG